MTCFCFSRSKVEAWSCVWEISIAWAERSAVGPLETSTWVSSWASSCSPAVARGAALECGRGESLGSGSRTLLWLCGMAYKLPGSSQDPEGSSGGLGMSFTAGPAGSQEAARAEEIYLADFQLLLTWVSMRHGKALAGLAPPPLGSWQKDTDR